MPWNNNNGGGSGGGGWQGGGGNNRGPWGQGPRGGGNGGGGNQPPDIDELIRKGQEKLREILPSGLSGGPGMFIAIFAVLLLVMFASTAVYRVDTDQQGVVLRFGNFVRAEAPGLHVKLPYPIETVFLPSVTKLSRLDIGVSNVSGVATRSVANENLMLTGDENIVDISFSVRWRIKTQTEAGNDIGGAPGYLFNVENPEDTIRSVAESAMREVVGQSNIQALLTTGRGDVEARVKKLIQEALDSYNAGILVFAVELQNSSAPTEVIDAFRDVQAAQADQERMQYEANSYANKVVPEARGKAAQITQAAEAYREQIVAASEGESKRFLSIYAEYKKSKDVTRRRIYLETMQEVFGRMNKVLIDSDSGSKGVLPYLPLSGLKPQAKSDSATSNSGATVSTSSTTSSGSR